MNKIIQTDNYILRAVVSKVDATPAELSDQFHLAFTTQLAGTRNPLEQRTAFATTLTREQLSKLRDILTLQLGYI